LFIGASLFDYAMVLYGAVKNNPVLYSLLSDLVSLVLKMALKTPGYTNLDILIGQNNPL